MKTISAVFAGKCLKKRRSDSHKGENGRVVVIGGSSDYVGAPALTGMAALACQRTGVDLVTVVAPEKAGFVINKYSPDLIVRKVKGSHFTPAHLKKCLEQIRKADVALIGNGMGIDKATMKFAKNVARKTNVPLVIDADAIKACRGMRFDGNAIITPHATEFGIFSGIEISGKKSISEKCEIVKKVAAKHRCVVLLKGKIDIISDGKQILLNKTGNEAMTAAGTGDVLAGIVAALVAVKNPLLNAAGAGAYINGAAGERVAAKVGYSLVASDIVKEIPATIMKIRKGAY